MTESAETGNLKPYTVGELSGAIKTTIANAFGRVQVRGEIVQPKLYPASGHLYLKLKDPDSDAILDAVVWKGSVARLSFRPEHGMDVLATGKLTTYPGRSSYQLTIDSMVHAGAGAILQQIEDRRKRLAAEGLFDPARKRRSDPGNPDVCPVFDLHRIFTPSADREWAATGCRTAGIGCLDCKAKLLEHLEPALAPIRERRRTFAEKPGMIMDILRDGSARARRVAQATMDQVHQVVTITP